MILVRNVFQAKYARGDELVEHLKESQPILSKYGLTMTRILTDLTGRFFTVVAEMECGSLGDLERESEAYTDPEFNQWFARMPELVDSGGRELFTVVDSRVGERAAKVVVERDVFQAKYGHGDALIDVLKGGSSMFESRGLSHRILTDTTGAFFTVVMELEWPSQVPLSIAHDVMFSKPEFGEWFARTIDHVDSGSRELFTIVD